MLRVFCGLLAATLLGAQSELPPEVLLLVRVKVKMNENLKHLPNYTCVQTIERSRRVVPDRKFQLADTLRLEVALVNGKELFAWPGARKFQEEELSDMVGGGTIGNGEFALHAKSLFLSHAPTFTYVGEESLSGRRAIRWDYRVPLLMSGFTIRRPPDEARVGYHGSFWADPETHDLIRLDVVADDIPPGLRIISATDTMEYARVPIGDSDFLLPKGSELTMVDLQGNESRNRARFTDCRQYTGESILSFNDPPPGPLPPLRDPERLVLPPKANLEMALDRDIELATVAVGDPVRAVLTRPLKHEGKQWAPKGAVVSGRIVSYEKYTRPTNFVVLGLRLDTLECEVRRAEFSATMVDAGPGAGLIHGPIAPHAVFRPGDNTTGQVPVQERRPGQGMIQWKTEYNRIPRGLRMVWQIDSSKSQETP